MIQGLVAQMNGTLEINSHPGTQFTIKLKHDISGENYENSNS